ncbi:hypothetical protein F511_04226 [Dorcoceras hygrometricum]|uniref:Uncharacterized protein n=1 Tax=Dorcoceras hygrometricum TaxID=472368 RepID=A0A2Z7BE08_9LAMI|nr:hypothetical protein F511_04226 [Dorcoceras hygrometricum]
MQRRRDQQPFFAFDLPAPATMAGALPAGPPPRPAGPNLTNHGPNRARMKENDPFKDSARRCAETRSSGFPFQPMVRLTNPTYGPLLALIRTLLNQLRSSQGPLQPLNRSHARRVQNREMQHEVRSARYGRCRREIGAQPALDRQAPSMAESFKFLCATEVERTAGV